MMCLVVFHHKNWVDNNRDNRIAKYQYHPSLQYNIEFFNIIEIFPTIVKSGHLVMVSKYPLACKLTWKIRTPS